VTNDEAVAEEWLVSFWGPGTSTDEWRGATLAEAVSAIAPEAERRIRHLEERCATARNALAALTGAKPEAAGERDG
jgi:hypothetical protein